MDIIMPQLGETVLEGTVAAWHRKAGDSVSADEPLFDVETEKVSTEIPSPVAGVLREILVAAGTTVPVGTRLAVVEPAGSARPPAPETKPAPAPAPATAPTSAPVPSPAGVAAPSSRTGTVPRSSAARLSPVVRRLLGEAGLAPGQVTGTGRDSRITREDVLAHIARGSASTPAAPSAPVAGPDDRVVPLNRVRRATAAHMVRSVATSPHTLQAVEVDFHAVERARLAHGERWKREEGSSLSYLPFICAAVCRAISEFPYVNASFGNDELVVHRRVHLGVAVDLAHEGLLAPVLRDANRRNLRGLALDLADLVARTRSGALKPDELAGGTYTLSNSGSFGTFITAPIINQPQVAILSTDGVHKKPVVIEGPDGDMIAIRPVGVLAQSFDHRAFDGAYSAAFLRRVKQEIEGRDWRAEFE
jgi:2-oxoglutarate dehydrogenase E2 component (dihydrolipoamide succinyltransferase)